MFSQVFNTVDILNILQLEHLTFGQMANEGEDDIPLRVALAAIQRHRATPLFKHIVDEVAIGIGRVELALETDASVGHGIILG